MSYTAGSKHRQRCRLSLIGLLIIAASLLLAKPVLAAPAPLGMRGFSYIDPEFEPHGNRIVFQDSNARAWVGTLDTETGQCISATCRDVQVASNLLLGGDPRYFFNGPEWGVSSAGIGLYLTKYDDAGIAQSWWVNPDGTGLAQLTFDPGGAWGGLVSSAPLAPSVRVIVSTGTANDVITGAWFNETDGVLHPMPGFKLNGQGGQFFVRSARYAVYAYKVSRKNTQIAVLDTKLQTTEIITDTPGQKSQSWGFEFGGVQYVAAVKDLAEIEIYRSGPVPWQKVATLTPPVPGYLYSTELLGSSGCFATSIQDTNDRKNYNDAAIYVACMDGSWTRVDDGAPMTRRSEPEAWWNGRHWLIYYNVNTTTIWVSDPFIPSGKGLRE